jgi:DNA-binding SARP family transcriptional activator
VAGTLTVRLLGGFDAEVDGRPVPPQAWRSDSDQLVKLLALEPTHHMLWPEVVERLWPMTPPRDAVKLLERAIKDVCKALHDGRAITVEGERLRLWPFGNLRVDAHTFAAHAKHAKSPQQRAEADAMYRGDLLPRDDEPWTSALRTRLRLVHLELLRDPDSGTPAWVDLRDPVFARTS